MESPCPTSSTSSVGPELTRGPTASSSVPTTSTAARPSDRARVGLGQATQSQAIAPNATTKPRIAEKPIGIDACGQEASHPAMETESAPMAPAKPSTSAPNAGEIAAAASPTSPASSTTETSGPTKMLATGETSESI